MSKTVKIAGIFFLRLRFMMRQSKSKVRSEKTFDWLTTTLSVYGNGFLITVHSVAFAFCLCKFVWKEIGDFKTGIIDRSFISIINEQQRENSFTYRCQNNINISLSLAKVVVEDFLF